MKQSCHYKNADIIQAEWKFLQASNLQENFSFQRKTQHDNLFSRYLKGGKTWRYLFIHTLFYFPWQQRITYHFSKKKFGPELWNIQRKILFKFILVIIEKHKKKNLQNYIENVSRFKADSNIPINYIRIELKLSFFEEGLINNILLVFFNQILSDPCHQIFVYFLIDFDETLLCPQLSRKS